MEPDASTEQGVSILATTGGVALGRAENVNVIPPPLKSAGRPIWLPPRPAALAGRDELLADVHLRLTGGDAPWPRIVALHGVGGVGKTSVAVEYAHRHQAEVGVAWLFSAEERTGLEAEFTQLAAQLGVSGGLLDPRDPVASTHSALADGPPPWLLIFDNVPSAEQVARFLPSTGPGRILITSVNAAWPHDQGIEVRALDTPVAAEFLTNRTCDTDATAALDLAAELGGLPLALEQAAAYIDVTKLSLAEYLGLFRERRAELLARGKAAGHPATVAATLGLALSRLESDSPAAVTLLRLVACLAPEPVPLALLFADRKVPEGLGADMAAALQPLAGDPLARQDAVAALRRYSLITPCGAHNVLIHRLVQVITLDQVDAEQAELWRHVAEVLTEAAVPSTPKLPAAWPDYAALLPHARAVLADDSDGMWLIALYLGYSGSYPAARELWHRIAYAHERRYGPRNRDTLAARANLADWTGEAGDAARARDLFAELLPVMQEVLGPQHRDTLAIRANLARWTGKAGDAALARDLFAELLPVMRQVLDPEHRDTLAIRASLAHWTGEAGDAGEARDLYAELLPIRERVLGHDDPDTAVTRDSLRYWSSVVQGVSD